MHPGASDANPHPMLDLWFADAEAPERELDPDASSWMADPGDELDAETFAEELAIPLADDGDAPPTESWNLGTEHGRTSVVAAALAPLLLWADLAFAAPPTGAAPEAPVHQPPTLPAETAEVPAQDPAPATPPPTLDAPAAAPTHAPAVRPTPTTSIWAGLVDRHVALTLADGSVFRATVLGLVGGQLVCARDSDGLVVGVDAAQIVTAHVIPEPKTDAKPPQTGQGMIVFGTIATAIGGALAIGAIATAASCGPAEGYYSSDFCPYYTIPIGVLSAVNLGMGIPLVVAGVRKRKRYREAELAGSAPQISGFVAPGREGVMAGVGLRF